jgi:hypothetical protein
MPFCTIVEWDQNVSDQLGAIPGADAPAAGLMVRIVGADVSGTHVIELWESSDDARRFGEAGAPALAQSALPPPTRVTGFETVSASVR